ncbi:ABC transporter permease [Pararhodobacter sp. SW119]|uniref:ABC transporter permease n=1 Tax=Pararhodobacter sp. SW119 TaxID=2780075 RepID=UPI001FD8654F|nr:ABC transporter permease [Pararhodobacter sp. SW119]
MVMLAAVLLAIIVLASIFAPWIVPHDPGRLSPSVRLRGPDSTFWIGTDAFGRDLFSRVVMGGQISLAVGVGAAIVSVAAGLALGLLAGYIRWLDAILMRFVDGLMAIPNILLAIAIVSLWGAGLWTVLIAITIPEIPRVVRLVRSVVLSAREEPYVEAAIAAGSSSWLIMRRHLLPNTVAPLIVQGTYICASAILVEAILSFLGAGINPETPSWGNIMAEGRLFFQINPGIILWPGLVVSVTILSINLLGDAVRDALDPRMAKRGIDR